MALYCGIVKLHRGDGGLSWKAVSSHHMTRGEFRSMLETVFEKALTASTARKLEVAERVRDRVMHGKRPPNSDKRNAIASLLEYAADFNEEVHGLAGFRPFGDMRGFKGRARGLDQRTTRWVLKGMGFNLD